MRRRRHSPRRPNSEAKDEAGGEASEIFRNLRTLRRIQKVQHQAEEAETAAGETLGLISSFPPPPAEIGTSLENAPHRNFNLLGHLCYNGHCLHDERSVVVGDYQTQLWLTNAG